MLKVTLRLMCIIIYVYMCIVKRKLRRYGIFLDVCGTARYLAAPAARVVYEILIYLGASIQFLEFVLKMCNFLLSSTIPTSPRGVTRGDFFMSWSGTQSRPSRETFPLTRRRADGSPVRPPPSRKPPAHSPAGHIARSPTLKYFQLKD
jgi:hypothetical protein